MGENKTMRTMLLCILLASLSFSHATEEETPKSVWDQLGLIDPSTVLIGCGVVSGIAIFLAVILKDGLKEDAKKAVFGIIAVPIAIATIYLSATTVYLNLVAETGGPVHWHADFEIWACGERQDLRDPSGFDNKVGSPLLHEHNDDRIHVEGVVYRLSQVTLGHFFEEVGGVLKKGQLTVPTNDGYRYWNDGDICPNGTQGEVQVFVYKALNATASQKLGITYVQEKVEAYHDHLLSPYSLVPPGDCIIIEFDKRKDRTERMCAAHQVAHEKGEIVEVEQ